MIKQDYRIDHVCFYLEEDVNRLAFLCDQDYDGAMYDPISQRLFGMMSLSMLWDLWKRLILNLRRW